MKFVYDLLRISLAIIFIYASIDKIINPKAFAAIIYSYKILPIFLINPVAICLPWLELILGILLILGKWCDGSVFLVNALLLSFWLILLANFYRGVDVSCGCFSTKPDASSNMTWYLFRDGLLVLMGIFLAMCHGQISQKT